MTNYLFILFALVHSFVSAQSIQFSEEEKEWIKNHPRIEFGYEPSWEPYEIYEDGEYKGIVGEYVKLIEEATNIDLVPIPNISWKESLEGLKNGDIKFVPCCAITPERKKFLEFTKVYINDPMVIVTRKDFEFISSLSDLNNRPVALPKSYYTAEMVASAYPKIKILEKEGIQSCLEALSYGEADAFVGNLGVVSYYINNKGFTNLKIAAPTGFKDNGIALATTKDWVIFRDIAEKVFSDLTQEEKNKIRNDWISVKYEFGISKEDVFKWFSIIALVVLLGFALFFIWNKKLRKQIDLRNKSERALKESLREIEVQNNDKKILLQEIHHRVKNNLQIITSIMRLQGRSNSDPNASRILNESIDRIKAIALIHDKIYNTANVSHVDIEQYIRTLSDEIISNISSNKIELDINSSIESLFLESIVPFALILNELITNSVKYGFRSTESPKIEINLFNEDDRLIFVYGDNGSWFENPKSDKFGSSLIEIFTEQLSGSYTLSKNQDGTVYRFEFEQSIVKGSNK